ncbi:MAG TPA: PaaI family thioesterase [Thermoleophilaceae bacterium]|jgi:1,4-dihydroxy-2-naphthoyl-CoA hydrolase
MPTEPQWPVSPAEALNGLLEFEELELGEELARARFTVENKHRQVFGLVHGGTYAALAEDLASHATAEVVVPSGMLAQGMSNNLSFLRPVLDGTVHAEARRRHRGRTTWVWDVDMTDDDGRLCCTARVTIAVRPMPDELKRHLGIA